MSGVFQRYFTFLSALLLAWWGGALTLNAESPWLYGIHWYGSSSSNDVEAMSDGKSLWVLENVNTWSSPSASGQQSKFATAVARGHTLIVRLQPRWGWAVPEEFEMASYLNAVRDTADLLKNQVHIWQIGNEMNNPIEYGGGNLTAAVYVDRFKRIRDTIHEVTSPLGPQVVLLGPPTSFAIGYQTSMLQLLDPQDVDGFAIHAYGLDPDPFASLSVNNFASAIQSHMGVIDAHGFEYKPVWITEFDRCSNPDTDAQEAVSAQFLWQAYDWLNGWNVNAGNHPIQGAMWFVYPDDSNWSCFSILSHKGGPSGENADLWDAFAFAANKAHASPGYVQALQVSPPTLTHTLRFGEPLPSDTIDVLNLGAGPMAYTVSTNVPWLDIGPASGSSSSEVDTLDVNFTLAGLLPNDYDATITAIAPSAIVSVAEVNVTIRILPWPGDMDADFDVDLDDFGQFQACLLGSSVAQDNPACENAHLDSDIDVDDTDLTLFLGCLTGANIPANPQCVP